jgi:hypothetical protein
LSGFYKDAAPPALGQAGFESHANGRKMFEPVSRTMGSRRDSSWNIHLNINSIHRANSWIDIEWPPDLIAVMVSSACDNPT